MGAGAAVMLGREKKLSFYERPRWSDAMPLTEVFFAVLLIGIYLTSWAEALFSRFGISWPQADIPALHGGVMWAAAVFRYVLVPAVMEELLFRGALLHTLRPLGERGACLTAALLFTLFHTSASHWPSIFLLGLLLCYAALHTQSLVVPMGCCPAPTAPGFRWGSSCCRRCWLSSPSVCSTVFRGPLSNE